MSNLIHVSCVWQSDIKVRLVFPTMSHSPGTGCQACGSVRSSSETQRSCQKPQQPWPETRLLWNWCSAQQTCSNRRWSVDQSYRCLQAKSDYSLGSIQPKDNSFMASASVAMPAQSDQIFTKTFLGSTFIFSKLPFNMRPISWHQLRSTNPDRWAS